MAPFQGRLALIFTCTLLRLLSNLFLVDALVVSAPPLDLNRLVPKTKDESSQLSVPKTTTRVRVRSTREQDLDEIASLLAKSIVGEGSPTHGWNWKTSMNFLKTKSSLQSMISQRYQVLKEGNKALSNNSQAHDEQCYSLADRLHLLWSHDGFRSKMKKAALMSKEPHIWKRHNFAYCPNDAAYLQHLMMSAVDANDKVIGFCEVAMLTKPNSHEHDNVACAPTIANLVTSSEYRRMGVGSGLVKSASRFVSQVWSEEGAEHEMALFVHQANRGATSLYNKHGFRRVCSTGEQDDMLYMTRPLA